MAVRKWYIDEALHSFARLMRVINRMTEEEVLEALKLESETRRRPTIMSRLIGKAARLNELQYVNHLKTRFSYGTEKRGADARG
jgi:hypothetical protein